RYVAMWAMLAERFGAHPAVLGYDVLNEPTPGSGAPQPFGAILAQFADLTGPDLETVAANFEDPAATLAQRSHLEDAALHRRLGDRLAPPLSEFEQGPIHTMYSEVVPALRAADPTGLILREHDYFG